MEHIHKHMILLTLIMKLSDKFANCIGVIYFNSSHIAVQCNHGATKLAIVVCQKEIVQIYMLGPQFVKIQADLSDGTMTQNMR